MSKYDDLIKERVEKDQAELDDEITKLIELGESDKTARDISEHLDKLIGKRLELRYLEDKLKSKGWLSRHTPTWLKWWGDERKKIRLDDQISKLQNKLNSLMISKSRSQNFNKIMYKYFSGTNIRSRFKTFSEMDFSHNRRNNRGNRQNNINVNYLNGWSDSQLKQEKSRIEHIKKDNRSREDKVKLSKINDILNARGNKGSNKGSGKNNDQMTLGSAVLKESILGKAATFNRILGELIPEVDQPSDYIEGEVARALFELCYNKEITKFKVKDIYDRDKKSAVPFSLRKGYDFLTSNLCHEILGDKLYAKIKNLKSISDWKRYEKELVDICNEFTDRMNLLTLLRKNDYGMNGKKANYLTFNPIIDKASDYNRSKYQYIDDYLGGNRNVYDNEEEFGVPQNNKSSNKNDKRSTPEFLDNERDDKSDSSSKSDDESSSPDNKSSFKDKLRKLGRSGSILLGKLKVLKQHTLDKIDQIINFYDESELSPDDSNFLNQFLLVIANGKDPMDDLINKMKQVKSSYESSKFLEKFEESGLKQLLKEKCDELLTPKTYNRYRNELERLENLAGETENFSAIHRAFIKMNNL